MKIQYVDKSFRGASLDIIRTAEAICEQYEAGGYELTLRQLYYQFVARGHLANTDQNYKRLGAIINDARLAGLIDWDHISDRTRYLRGYNQWDSPSDIINASAAQYRRNLWAVTDQPFRPEVWVEKDALVDVVKRACSDYQVPFFSCRGYVSQSEMWAAGRRMRNHYRRGYTPMVIHLGDHDPSGIDMSRDIEDRLGMFAEQPVEVRRIALNMDQVETYGPPPNPAKLTDSRGSDYIQRFGTESWELDALEPSVLVALIQAEVATMVDEDAWALGESADAAERDRMQTVAWRWDDIVDRWDDINDVLDD